MGGGGQRKRVQEVRGSKGGGVGGFGFLMGVSGVGDGSIDGDGRRQRQTVSGSAGGGVIDAGGAVNSCRQERGWLAAARAAE